MIRIVRLGSPRARGEGARVGTVRRPPRGVRKEDHARRDWPGFVKAYRREMKAAGAERLLDALAQLSQRADFRWGAIASAKRAAIDRSCGSC